MLSIETARAWYPESDPVHGFNHILRVYQMAIRLAQAEGADLEIVGAAALLHDARPPQSIDEKEMKPHATRLSHHQASADFASLVLSSEGWSEERIAAVQHCIRAHRFRDETEQPQTKEAQILFDADKLDAIGAIGVARAIGFAVQAGQPEYSQVSERFQREGVTEPGEPHSSYHEYILKLRLLKDRLYTATARAIAKKRHHFMEEYYTQLAAELTGDR